MTILKIVKYPDPILRRKSSSIEFIDNDVKKLINDMIETMYNAEGVGLAAVQVGILKRIFVIDVSESKNNPQIFINPIIRNISDEKKMKKEGCLSLVATSAEVPRYEKIEIEYLDYNGEKQILQAEGLFSQALQHEFDHLEGIIYSDHLPMVKKLLVNRKASKYSTQTNSSNN